MLFFSAQQISGRLGLPCLGRKLLKNTIGMSAAHHFRAHSLQLQKNKKRKQKQKKERRQEICLPALFSRDKPRDLTFCLFVCLDFIFCLVI